MKNRLMMLVAVVAVMGLMVSGPLAYAGTQGESPKGEKKWRDSREGKEFFKELNLTQEQKASLKSQRESQKEAGKVLREQQQAKMQALHEAIAKPGATRESVNGLVGEVNALEAQSFSQKIDGIFAMKEVLTPEQFTKMQEHRKDKMKDEKNGRGKHGDWNRRGQDVDENQNKE